VGWNGELGELNEGWRGKEFGADYSKAGADWGFE